MVDESNHHTVKITFPIKDMRVWQKFVVGLKTENRFTLSEEPAKFIELLIDYAKKHKTKILSKDTSLYRARINDGGNNKAPFPIEHMGAPPAHLAGHGRLNPKGIPYLYLASNEITAVCEIRPWVGCKITLAELVLLRECELINFSKKHFVNIPEGEEFEGPEFTWRELITWMFSAPFDPRDDTAYIPTQYLAERVKGAGFDGIIYDSALSEDGYNITLFDVGAVKGVSRQKAKVTSIDVKADFKEITNNQ